MRACILALSPMLLAPLLCSAAGVERLLMPGEVIAAHAKYEEECGRCHDRSNRQPQRALCLTCHEEVAADLSRAVGFHGLMQNAAQSECRACHSEHQGRAADIVKFIATGFDHSRTNFKLEGLHTSTACGRCHQQGRKYRDAPNGCVDCHRDRDPHAGGLGLECGACHTSRSWVETRFDHAKTRFALAGAHSSAACGACHMDASHRDTPRECAACHAADDVHRGARSPACANCHDVNSWSSAKFDHAGETGFALHGAHAQASCEACHRSGDYRQPLPNTCHGCHRADDAHATRFGERCDRCHTNEAWRPFNFDHLRDARFALTGAHEPLECHRCHTAETHRQKLTTECRACHASDDVHGGTAQTACQDCHGGDAWRPAVRFDHDLSAFPLTGLHVAIPCANCHSSHAFKRASAECNACHRKDDVHRGALGERCAECHTPNGWPLWEFDHAVAVTGFALDGAHAPLQCVQCHREPAGRVKVASDCAACHRNEDVHLGQFGHRCDQCHSTASFKGARRASGGRP